MILKNHQRHKLRRNFFDADQKTDHLELIESLRTKLAQKTEQSDTIEAVLNNTIDHIHGLEMKLTNKNSQIKKLNRMMPSLQDSNHSMYNY